MESKKKKTSPKKEVKKNDSKTSNKENWGKLVSNLNEQQIISYGKESIIVPPKGTTNRLDKNKLGKLPNGIVFIKEKNK